MKKFYSVFDKFVFRTPLWGFLQFDNQAHFSSDVFNEALRLASPEFFSEKIKTRGDFNAKMKLSLYKYLTRSSTRSTPFGLFAGCSVGTFGDGTVITINPTEQSRRITRLDMNYMCALIQSIEKNNDIRHQLTYYANDSLYRLGGVLRYVEYYYRGVSRVHNISSVEKSDYLVSVLNLAVNGATFQELANSLVCEDISYDEAADFIEELMDTQLLKSELELAVTGHNSLNSMIKKLEKLNHTEVILKNLTQINALLSEIDNTELGKSLNQYDLIIEKIKELQVKFEPKFLFQTDLYKDVVESIVCREKIEGLNEVFDFLNKITPKSFKTNLSEFRKAYYERYENREMPLLEVLDTELGIGYLQNGNGDVPNELIGNVPVRVGGNGGGQEEGQTGRMQAILLNKYMTCVKNGEKTLLLTDEDVKDYQSDWKDCPSTIYSMCSLLKDNNGDDLIEIISVGGSSGANLLGRFAHLDNKIEKLSKEIAEKDQELAGEAILAEIVHLPESRIGNILFRPVLREYEIHYLAHSEQPTELRIPLSDLYLSIQGDRVIMRSKRLNKEIIPRLTTAHNFSYNALPVYHFLCEMQHQNIRSGLYFSWDRVFNAFDYHPRVQYKHFILSRERWLIDTAQIKEQTSENIKEYLKQKRIPNRVIIADGDNEQFIDFDNEDLMQLFLTLLKKRTQIWIQEFLFNPEQAMVKDSLGNEYCNQFIFSFYRNSLEK